MSSTNGHSSECATIEDFLKASTEVIELPGLTQRQGKPFKVRFGLISRSQYFSLMPPPIPGAETWEENERTKRFEEYLAGLTPEARRAWNQQWADLVARVVSTTIVEPRLTIEQVGRLGDDVTVLFNAIVAFSKIFEPAPALGEPVTEAVEAPESRADAEAA
jgi:hypothetical protein